MKTKYSTEPRIKKRWFKENELWYDLVKTTGQGKYMYNGIDSDWIEYDEFKTVFSSKDIDEVLTIIQHLNKINK